MTAITTEPEVTKARKRLSRKFLTKLAIGAGRFIVAFLIGYIPSTVSSRIAKQENVELEHKLRVAELGSQLAMASYEAGRNNYANATQFSTRFFSGLGELIAETKDQTLKQKTQVMLARRDEITADLARADEAVKEKLAQMYAEFFQVTQADKALGQ